MERSVSSEEHELLRQLRRGDRAALEAFSTTYIERIYHFVYYRVAGDEPAAEDITQETLLAALDGLERFDSKAAVYTWLCGIARHKVADYYRRLRRLEQIRVTLAAQPDDTLGPSDLAERDERRERVMVTLRGLPPHYQQALTLKYLDQLSGRELAAKLLLSEEAAESLLTRARQSFRRAYREGEPNAGENTIHERA